MNMRKTLAMSFGQRRDLRIAVPSKEMPPKSTDVVLES